MAGHRIVRLLAAGAALLSLAACGEKEVADRPPAVRPVKLMTVGAEAAASGVRSFPGRVEAANQVDLSFRVGGPLVALSAKEGQRVGKGRLLARIDPRDYEIRLRSARAHAGRTDADLRRYSALYEKAAISEVQLDQAQAAYDVAQAALADAAADLRDTELKAPFAGVIGETFVENFQDVRPKERIVSLVDITAIDIVIDVPEGLLAGIDGDRQGQGIAAMARFDTARGREFPLQLSEIAAQADPRTQTYRVTLTMPQPEGVNVLPGMTVTVVGENVANRGEQEIVIPAIAVFSDGASRSQVWVFDESSRCVGARSVSLGDLRGSDSVVVTDGLAAGEQIAVTAVSRLREGMEIRPLSELEGFR